MNRLTSALALLFGSLLLSTATAESLRIHGSNTIGARLAPALVEGWLAAEGYREIRRETTAPEELRIRGEHPQRGTLTVEVHAHGTSTGYRDLLAGAADIAMSSRPATASEREAALAANLGDLADPRQEHVLALDGLGIVVGPQVRIEQLTLKQVRALYTGEISNWMQLGGPALPVQRHARDDKSGTWDTFRALVLGSATMAEARRYEDTDALVADVNRTPGAIGFAGMAALKGATRVLQIADAGAPALAPELSHVATEDYVLARRLYLYTAKDPAPRVLRLIEFALSPLGQSVVGEVGYVPMRIETLSPQLSESAPAEYRTLVQGHQRLSLNFRFGAGVAFLDSRAERDLQRLAAFMKQPEQRGQRLKLVGFTDSGDLRFAQEMISIDRAEYIAYRLSALGVPVDRVRGYGGASPVAGNDSEAGRARNRRVEVWIGAPQAASLAARDRIHATEG
ncbi:MAG: phosphate ABC transporter substrate-binding/OmpA family protein [Xanthomonadales bacterium]|jgi:phosphate transport system substrate-binding protein|nr:phosphate ABC transporter substrate-binding/OmpA family protein [Xanthomonadales bacterium]